MSLRRSIPAAVLFALLSAAVAVAQDESKLLGRWVGCGDGNRGEKLVIERDSMTMAGRRVTYKVVEPGVIQFGDDEAERARWQIKDDELTLAVAEESRKYKREDAAPKAEQPKATEAGAGRKPANPLAPAPAADPFARAFKGDGIALELEGAAAAGYRGKLVFREVTYAAEASAEGANLRGRFQVEDHWFDFTATLAEDRLTLASGGQTYELTGARREVAAVANPLAAGGAGKADGAAVPPALEGAFTGKTARYEHPRGWFGFDMPEGWSVYQQNDTGMVLNPGLKPTDTIDALVGLVWGRLEAVDQNQPVAKVIGKHVPEFRQALAQQGIAIGEPDAEIRVYQGKDVPGGVLTFAGRTAAGRKLMVWCGGIVKRDGWIAVNGVVLEGREAAFLPQIKRIFTSLEPRPPERNAKLEAALVGRTFSASQYGKSTDSAHHASYDFADGGVVTRRLMSNIPAQPSLPGATVDTERSGRYEVCGDVLYLYFETGQEAGQVLVEGGQVAGIRLGSAEYR